jgi:hypothetical protein
MFSKFLDYYKEDYFSSRKSFREISNQVLKNLNLKSSLFMGKIPVSSKRHPDLTVDYTFLPAKKKSMNTVILVSGTHGVEAATGAAIQRMFLDSLYQKLVPRESTSVLLIHALNPFGFVFDRRTTERNVDLNRNFSLDTDLFGTKNSGYVELNDLLNPKGKANSKKLTSLFFPIRAIYNIATKGMSAIRQAALQGQYSFPEGIYFGGAQFEPICKPTQELLQKAVSGAKKVLFIDFHTGYGERGKLHLFSGRPLREENKDLTEEVFSGYPIEWPDSENFYPTTGEIIDFVTGLVKKSTDCVSMVFEYGTLNSQTIRGSIESMKRLILENQGFVYGFSSTSEERKIRTKFRELFFPKCPKWRETTLTQTAKVFENIFPRFLSDRNH